MIMALLPEGEYFKDDHGPSAGVKNEGEYFEDDHGPSAGVKNEGEY